MFQDVLDKVMDSVLVVWGLDSFFLWSKTPWKETETKMHLVCCSYAIYQHSIICSAGISNRFNSSCIISEYDCWAWKLVALQLQLAYVFNFMRWRYFPHMQVTKKGRFGTWTCLVVILTSLRAIPVIWFLEKLVFLIFFLLFSFSYLPPLLVCFVIFVASFEFLMSVEPSLYCL